MQFDVPCKQGRLQITDQGILCVVSPYGRPVWQIPLSSVVGLSTARGAFGSFNVTVNTAAGNFQADMVSKPNFEKLQAGVFRPK